MPTGATHQNKSSFPSNSGIIELTDATLPNCYFQGWYTDESFNSPITEIDTAVANDMVLYAKFLTINTSSNLPGAANFVGAAADEEGTSNSSDLTILANEGYTFLYYELNGVRGTGNVIPYDSLDGEANIVAYFDYATYELPIVNINTNNAKITSKENYVDMVFSLTNSGEEFIDVPGGIRLRGNSTMNLPKKPYRIKLDEKLSLFGLDKAKSWVLLAEYLDPSALHNYTAFSLAQDADGLSFTPSPHKVNVYLNGEFQGLYTLCEQVQENKGRMNIEEDITEDMTSLKDFNFFICMDKSCISDAGAAEGVTYFYLPEYDKYFELKYPEKDQFVNDAQFEKFFSELVDYTKMIMDAYADKDIDTITAETNLNSLVDFMIVDQIMGESDHSWKSFNMYFTHTSDNPEENNKLNFGPIWDYDWALYTPWTFEPNEYYEIKNQFQFSNHFYKSITSIEEFQPLIKEQWTKQFAPSLQSYLNNLDSLVASMSESLELNQQKWYSDKPDLTANNLTFLNDYLASRITVLNKKWSLS